MKNATYPEFTALTVDQALKKLQADATQGLKDTTIQKLKKIYGPNSISVNKHGWQDILMRQFKSPFVYIFVLIAIPSLFLNEYINAVFILLCVLINTSVGFYQEFKAQKNLDIWFPL